MKSISVGDIVLYKATVEDAKSLQVRAGREFPAVVTAVNPLVGDQEVSIQVFFKTAVVAKLRVQKGAKLGEYSPRAAP